MATQWTHTTFAQARNRLAAELGDPSKVFFTDTELGLYIIEALRTWGLAAMYWRDTVQFQTVAGQAFYSLPDVAQDLSANLLQSYTVTDREVLQDVIYAAMETPITNWALGWQGTEMFSLNDITAELQDARDMILKDSGVVVTERSGAVTPGTSRFDLNEAVIKVIRGSIDETGGAGPIPLWGVDSWQLQSSVNSAIIPAVGRPKQYALNYTPQLALDLWPPPATAATLRTYGVEQGATLDPTSTATVLGLPDDACWIAKYRTLLPMYEGDGLARAPQMAEFADKRWRQGLDLLSTYQSIIWSTVGGRRMTIASLDQLDKQRPLWQQSSGQPTGLYQLGWNLFAAYPVPDATYTLTMEIVRKAPIPVADGDYIQLDRSLMQSFYFLAQHIAAVKMQGAEFEGTFDLYEEAMEMAQQYAASQAATSLNWRWQQMQAKRDRLSRPFRLSDRNDQAKAEGGSL